MDLLGNEPTAHRSTEIFLVVDKKQRAQAMSDIFVNISTKVTKTMRDGLDKVAKEYNVSRSEMLRILITEVVDDDAEYASTRSYPRRRTTGGLS